MPTMASLGQHRARSSWYNVRWPVNPPPRLGGEQSVCATARPRLEILRTAAPPAQLPPAPFGGSQSPPSTGRVPPAVADHTAERHCFFPFLFLFVLAWPGAQGAGREQGERGEQGEGKPLPPLACQQQLEGWDPGAKLKTNQREKLVTSVLVGTVLCDDLLRRFHHSFLYSPMMIVMMVTINGVRTMLRGDGLSTHTTVPSFG